MLGGKEGTLCAPLPTVDVHATISRAGFDTIGNEDPAIQEAILPAIAHCRGYAAWNAVRAS